MDKPGGTLFPLLLLLLLLLPHHLRQWRYSKKHPIGSSGRVGGTTQSRYYYHPPTRKAFPTHMRR